MERSVFIAFRARAGFIKINERPRGEGIALCYELGHTIPISFMHW